MAVVFALAVCWTAVAWADRDGFTVHEVASPFQAGPTRIKVLVPDRLDAGRKYPTVYVLPVERGGEHRYGDGLEEIKRRDLHNRHLAVFVAPEFSHLPWYADHPADPGIRQESHFVQVVVPFIERHYPVRGDAEGRWLLGFSKSGWGALSLLLRHPDRFGKAAVWDAPLMKDRPDQFGMEAIFGSQDNFENYRIAGLLPRRAAELGGRTRIVLLGYGNFREHHQQAHQLLQRLGIPHEYRDGPARTHDWHSGWVEEAVRLLFADR